MHALTYLLFLQELENQHVFAVFPFFVLFISVTEWVFMNLFVVILVDSFTQSLIMSELEIHDEDLETFKGVWTTNRTNETGPFSGRTFTLAPLSAPARGG
jgi:hypothetical protein